MTTKFETKWAITQLSISFYHALQCIVSCRRTWSVRLSVTLTIVADVGWKTPLQ